MRTLRFSQGQSPPPSDPRAHADGYCRRVRGWYSRRGRQARAACAQRTPRSTSTGCSALRSHRSCDRTTTSFPESPLRPATRQFSRTPRWPCPRRLRSWHTRLARSRRCALRHRRPQPPARRPQPPAHRRPRSRCPASPPPPTRRAASSRRAPSARSLSPARLRPPACSRPSARSHPSARSRLSARSRPSARSAHSRPSHLSAPPRPFSRRRPLLRPLLPRRDRTQASRRPASNARFAARGPTPGAQ